jgi:hypothetical protein
MTTMIPIVTLLAAALGLCALGLALGGSARPPPHRRRNRSTRSGVRRGERGTAKRPW